MLGTYGEDFYADTPALTVNRFGSGKAYYAAFRNDDCFADDFCAQLIEEIGITPDAEIQTAKDVTIRKRGNCIFVMNFSDREAEITLERTYKNIVSCEEMSGKIALPVCGYLVLE